MTSHNWLYVSEAETQEKMSEKIYISKHPWLSCSTNYLSNFSLIEAILKNSIFLSHVIKQMQSNNAQPKILGPNLKQSSHNYKSIIDECAHVE